MSTGLRNLARRAGLVAGAAAVLLLLGAGALAFVADPPVTDVATAAGATQVGAAASSTRTVTRPVIVSKPVPFGSTRKAEISAYCKRHYGISGWRLTPKVIVLHFTAGADWRATWNYFASDAPDPEFHELPGPASHFIIAKDGTIYQCVPLNVRTRSTYGLNYVAVGIEFAQECPSSSSWADQQILNRPAQVNAGLRLVAWLQAKYKISMANVIGHSMARTSPYYKDLVRPNTPDHGDWQLADVKVFRARLKQLR